MLATRTQRFLAFLVDGVIAMVGVSLFVTFRMPTLVSLWVIGYTIYQIYLLSTIGQTIGKKVMGVKIVLVSTKQNGGFVPNVLLRTLVNGLLSAIPLYS